MAKRKQPHSHIEFIAMAREYFKREIEHLLSKVPGEQWDDPDVRGVLYDFLPWHRSSSITIQTRDDDPRDIGAWKYYESSESGEYIQDEYDAYHNAKQDWRIVYHRLLIAAAEALLDAEFGKYINPNLPTPVLNLRNWPTLDDGFCLKKTFYVQVYDHDESFRFNFCEYVMARRIEQLRL